MQNKLILGQQQLAKIARVSLGEHVAHQNWHKGNENKCAREDRAT